MAESLQIDANKKQGIQNRSRARQIIDFSGIKYGNITPTDIDGGFEKQNEVFVFFEMKYGDAEMPTGQKLFLTRLVDICDTAGKKAVLFLCHHNVWNTEKDVIAAESTVTDIYFRGRWSKAKGETLKVMTDRFMAWALPFPEI